MPATITWSTPTTRDEVARRAAGGSSRQTNWFDLNDGATSARWAGWSVVGSDNPIHLDYAVCD